MATNTAASFTNHTGNGTAGPFNISFSYLAEAEVDVTVGGVLKTITTHYTFTSATQITFTSGNEPANGVAIKFQRDTNISAKKVDFADGSVLTEADLDANSDQVLFAQQEIIDKLGTIEENATGDQTAAEIRTLVESASDSNVFTDADHSKLNAIEASATADQTAAEIRTLVESASDSNVFTDADHTKLNNIEANATADQTAAEIRTLVESASDSNVFTDADHTKLNGIEAGATADQTITEIKTLIAGSPLDASHLAANSVTTSEIADAELTTLAGMQSGTASKLADSTALTSDIADLNQLDGMAKQTTITDDDTKFPTSGAVVDFVAAQIAPLGGLEVIANEDSFPTTQPASGVVISISDIDGLIVNGSGVATNARTLGNGSDNVTINGFPSSLHSKTMAAGLGLMVSSTGSSQTYTYHKLLAKEVDVEQLSNDINDFAARYRVGSSNPTSDNDAGDLFFNTSTQKLLVFNATSNAFEEAQSVGNFFISTLSPAFNGSTQDFTITNAPSNAQQIILSINGVIQKPNSGTSTPSEGFALTGSTVKLAAAPPTGSDYFAIVLGSTVNIGTPSNNTVTTAILQNGSVTTAKIADDAVTGAKIADDTITDDHLAPNSVRASQILDGQVGTAELANASVTNAKVDANAAIDGTKINPNFGSQGIDTTGDLSVGDDITITGHNPHIFFVDSSDNPDYKLQHGGGELYIQDVTNGVARFKVNADGHIDISGNLDVGAGIDVTGAITGTGDMTIDTNTLHVDSSNNRVGMGTTSPSSKLHVKGSGEILRLETTATTGSNYINFNDADENKAFIGLGSGSDDSLSITLVKSSNLRFATSNTERMRIDSSGRVMIGITSSGVPFQINATASAFGGQNTVGVFGDTTSFATGVGGGITLSGRYNSSSSQVGFGAIRGIKENGTDGNYDGALTFSTRPNQGSLTERMRIDSSGHVTIPNQPCTVVTNATTGSGLTNSQNGVVRTFESTHINQGGMTLSNTRSRITVPTSGTYYVAMMLTGGINTVEAGDGIIMRLRRNGTNYPTNDSHPVESFGNTVGEEWTFTWTLPVILSANDYIEMVLDNIGGTVNFNIQGGYFSASLMH